MATDGGGTDGSRKRTRRPGTEFGRRGFLLSLAGSALLGFGLRAGTTRGSAGPLCAGCRLDDEGRYFTSGFRADGATVFDLELPGRGHAISFRPGSAQCVVYARRPGRFAVVLDAAEGVALHRIDAAPGRHFYGHGTYSADGRYLLILRIEPRTGRQMAIPIAERLVTPWDNHLAIASLPVGRRHLP